MARSFLPTAERETQSREILTWQICGRKGCCTGAQGQTKEEAGPAGCLKILSPAAESIAQLAECLSSMHKALGSVPSTTETRLVEDTMTQHLRDRQEDQVKPPLDNQQIPSCLRLLETVSLMEGGEEGGQETGRRETL